MKKIPNQEYTPEFKELAVKRVKDGLSIGAVAKELGMIIRDAEARILNRVQRSCYTG